jgi:hypothetical protein
MDGKAGLFAVFAIGTRTTPALTIDPYGNWFVDPFAPIQFLYAGQQPAQLGLHIPPEVPVGASFAFQALGFDLVSGNVSNAVEVKLQ